MKYFLVVQAPAYPLAPDSFAVESAFAVHLRELKALLGPACEELVLIGPALSEQAWRTAADRLSTVDQRATGIRFLPAFPVDLSRAQFLLRRLVPTWRWLKSLFAQPCIVHSGMSTELARPLMFMASLAGRRMGRPVMFMVDMDFREHARRFYRTGQWSLKSYLVNRLAYDPLKWLQLWLAPRLFDLCCFKGDALVRDFGRGRPNVRRFYDTVHSEEDILSGPALERRLRWMAEDRSELKAVYFGRLAVNKGLDRIIEAAGLARDRGTRVHLRIIGDGDCRESLAAQVSNLGLDSQVEFIATVAYGEPLFRLLEDRHVCVAAPLIEDTPRAAFDAFCRALPLIAFDIAYFRDLAAESGAVIVTPWPEVAGLADALVRLSNDRTALGRMARDAVEFAAANTQEIWLKRRLSWLEETTAGRAQ